MKWRWIWQHWVLAAFCFAGAFHINLVLADELPQNYWALPIPSQGAAPDDWHALEKSLAAENCGQCHQQQFEDWQTSLHAHAMSPGLVGQLLNFDAGTTAGCLKCHAPLTEQNEDFVKARQNEQAHMPAAQGLAASGISCGTCHVRNFQRYGPPKRETGVVGQSSINNPHGGVMRSAEFEQSNFCAACHQFDASFAINGKPLQNTIEEWRDSDASGEGKTCQSCHMPDRRHLWRGIHDPQMVSSGLKPAFYVNEQTARFRLTSVNIGHAFPTYVTPRVWMKGVALDHDGMPVATTEVSYVIGRRVESTNGQWVERSDTRLMPGDDATLDMRWGATGRVKFWLEVHPDDFYDHDVFDALLRTYPPESAAAALITQADERARKSRFTLYETVLQHPSASAHK